MLRNLTDLVTDFFASDWKKEIKGTCNFRLFAESITAQWSEKLLFILGESTKQSSVIGLTLIKYNEAVILYSNPHYY
jgi:hypothetical protein